MTITGVAAGVPYVALAPENPAGPAPLLVSWHLMDPPCTEVAMAAALPLAGLPAWRVHFGLPMFGSRLPAGGFEEIFGLAAQDAVLNLYQPVVEQAVAEFPAALAAVRAQLSIADGPVTLLGGSAGGLVALRVLTGAAVPVTAAVLVNPVSQLAPLIAANERSFGTAYDWTRESRAAADRYDFVRHADRIDVPVLVVVGEADDIAIKEPAELLAKAAPDAELVTIPGMAHALADPPGIEAAPQNDDAARVDAVVTQWLRPRL